MTEVNSRLLPATRETFYDSTAVNSGDPTQMADYLKKLTNDNSEMYKQIATKFNLGPEYTESNSQPQPAEGQFLVWLDSGNNTYYLMYGLKGQGAVKVQMSL